MRLFVAIDLPPEAKEALSAEQQRIARRLTSIRLVKAAQLHLTLVFLGYRPEKEIPAIAAAASAAVADLPAARLTATAVTPVPKRHPRLFALDLDDDGGRATALQAAASDALAAGRFYTPERRPFWPHLTFARVKRGARATPLDDDPPPGPLEASRVTLYRSLLSPRGARYEPLDLIDLD